MEKSKRNKLYFDPIGGIAGDMFSAAFINAGLIDLQTLQKTIALFDNNIQLIYDETQHSQIIGGKLRVLTPQGEETYASLHEHEDHPHHAEPHEHYPFQLIRERLLASDLPPPICQLALAIFTTLAQAEAKLHHTSLETLSFHEVGRDDAIADIIAAATCICCLPVDTEIYCGPLPLGQGEIKFSHGCFPLPAPATIEILKDIPVVAGKGQYEMTTPTGAPALPSEIQERIQKDEQVFSTHFLTLIGSFGDESAWQARQSSNGHQAIPLTEHTLKTVPMVARLFQQIGFQLGMLSNTEMNELHMQGISGVSGVFYVEEALQSPYIPAQDFVKKYAVKSVVGTGVLLPEGEVCAFIGFCRVPLSKKQATILAPLMSKFWRKAFSLSKLGVFK